MTTTTDHDDNIARVDAHTIAVAAHLPFLVELEADMGGTFALHIDLGTRGTHPGDPADTAGVDPDPDNGPLEWWLDIDGGCETICSGLTIDTDPAIVAAWITEQARLHDCSAAR